MGKFLFVASLLSVSALANAGSAGSTSADAWRLARPRIEVQIKRMPTPDTYVVKATISDLKSGKVLAEPKLITHANTPARIEVGEKGVPGSIAVDIDVMVASSGATAVYTSEIRDNDQVISTQVLTLAVSD